MPALDGAPPCLYAVKHGINGTLGGTVATMRRRARLILRRARRASGVGLTMAGYLVATFGFPLPARSAKDLSVPFPCQHRACGCRSAAQCFENCCCFTREEHVAWARSNQVELPPTVAGHGWNDRPKREVEHPSCCKNGSCCGGNAAKRPQCCSTRCDHRPQQTLVKKPTSRPSGDWVMGDAFRKCRSLTLIWVQGGAALPVAIAVPFTPGMPATGHLQLLDLTAPRLALIPATPPPREFPI